MMEQPHNKTLLTGVTVETVISANECRLIALLPQAVTTGTLTVRENATPVGGAALFTVGAGLPQVGQFFGDEGIRINNGLTIQPTVAGDSVLVIWRPLRA